MSTIFISHSSADNALARQLETRLRQQNHTCVFLDLDPEKGIVAGRSWERTLYRKLRACRVVVSLCTDAYLKSHWCFAEIALARMEGKPIIALLADPLRQDTKLPSIISEKQFIDIRTNPEDGYRRLWRGLKELDLLGMVGGWDPKSSPYLGLNAYHEEHAPVFFGREPEVRAGIELLDRGAPGLIMVLGASGSGKSSLARAGILPRLRREPKHWIIADPFRPGRDPFAELAHSISQCFRRYVPDAPADTGQADKIQRRLEHWRKAPETGQPQDHGDAGEPPATPPESELQPDLTPEADARLGALLAELEALRQEPPTDANASLLQFLDWSLDDLRRICNQHPAETPQGSGSKPLVDLAYQLRRDTGQPDARLLLVIDQFEELLGQGAADTAGRRLLQLLAASLAVDDVPLTVFVTMRSDFLESFQKANSDLDIDFESLSLGPMPVEGLRQVIEAPAKLGAIELEPGLADRLLKDASSPDALPLLSFTLWLLWRDCHRSGTMSLDAYKALGGLEGAVASEADAILDRARQKDREPALRIAFLEMVRLADDGQFARQPVPWETPEFRPVHDLLDDFVERRLLVSRAEGGVRVVEVAHESLFRTWQPLRTWIEEHRAELLLRQQLRSSALAWDKSGRPADHLWRGARLEQAVELLQAGGLDGNSPDVRICKSFVQVSEAARKRQSRRRRNTVVAVTAVLLGFLGFALVKEHEAKRAQRSSAAQQLALTAIDTIETKPLAGIELARKAMCVTHMYDGFVLDVAHGALNRAVQAAQRQRILRDHNRAVTDLRFLPSGQTVDGAADGVQRMISLGRDRSVLLWRIPGRDAPRCSAIPKPNPIANTIRRIAVDPRGGFVAAAAAGGNVDLFDTADSTARPTLSAVLPQQAEVSAITVATDGSRMAVAGHDGSVLVTQITEMARPSPGIALPRQDARIVAMAFNADATRLATAGWQGTVALWDSDTGARIHQLDGHTEAITALAIRGNVLASAGWDKSVKLWDVTSGALLHSFEHDARISALAFVVDRRGASVLASASWDKTVRLWDVASGRPLHTLEHNAPVVSLAVAPPPAVSDDRQDGGFQIATGSWDGRVYLWTIDHGQRATATRDLVALHLEPVNDLAFNADGSRLASASDDKTIKVSTLRDQADEYIWQSSLDVQHSAQGAENEKWVAMITQGGVQVLDAEQGRVREAVSGYTGNANRIAFSTGDTSRIAIEADDLFEYYLDPRELMMCAGSMSDPASAIQPADPSMTELCTGVELDASYASLWSRARSGLDWLR